MNFKLNILSFGQHLCLLLFNRYFSPLKQFNWRFSFFIENNLCIKWQKMWQKINFPRKNHFHGKWFFEKTIFLPTKHYLRIINNDHTWISSLDFSEISTRAIFLLILFGKHKCMLQTSLNKSNFRRPLNTYSIKGVFRSTDRPRKGIAWFVVGSSPTWISEIRLGFRMSWVNLCISWIDLGDVLFQ